MNDLLLFAINGGGWALKPILEKISVDKLGHYYFSFLRYFISGIIAIPFLIQHYYFNGFPKVYKNDAKLFFKDVVIWGTIVSVVAIAAIMANYYLLEKYYSTYQLFDKVHMNHYMIYRDIFDKQTRIRGLSLYLNLLSKHLRIFLYL